MTLDGSVPSRDSVPSCRCLAGFEEEGLLLEDTAQTPVEENPLPEELPAELPSPEAAEVVTLPEPPVEVEASGSGDLEELLQPTTPAEAEVSVEETGSDDGPITEDAELNELPADNVSEAITEEVEVAAVEEEPTMATLDEEQLNEAEIPEEPEISTVASETTEEEVEEEEEEVEEEVEEEEEGLPAEVPPPEPADVANEASETDLLPVGDNSAEDTEEAEPEDVNPEPPAEEADVNAETYPEAPVLEEVNVEEVTEIIDHEVKEEIVPEAPAAEEKVSDAPQISTEDLAEDEILLVNQDLPEPLATDYLSPAPPTALSPERESPFTRISDVNPATEGQPHIILTPLVEVIRIQANTVECR